MQKIFYTVGLPASGKSAFVQTLAKKERAVILSTDEIRKELFGDESKQGKASAVYRELFSRLERVLKDGKNVIVDATNIERERRIKALKKLPQVEKHLYYFSTPYEVCLERNSKRKRNVEEKILEKMRRNLEFPMIGEGWDALHVIHEPYAYDITKDRLVSLLEKEASYEELFQILAKIPVFNEMYHFNQENPYHQFMLCEHTYYVLQYVNEYYEGEDKLKMQLAALFHDTGKVYTKTFKPLKGYCSYFGHENLSAQLACHMLTELGFDEEFVLDVVSLIQMHMLINYGGDEGASQIYHLLGGEMLTKLYFFREADRFAK